MGKKGKTVLIMGLGLHGGGAGAANYFISKGDRVVITDLRTEEELERSLKQLKRGKKVRLVLGRHDFRDFKEADLIIKNPGVPRDSPYLEYALKNGIPVDTDIGIFLKQIAGLTDNIIGITGTKGKSTTAALIHRIVQQQYSDTLIGGNITISVFDVLDRVKKNSFIVLELSSFQLGGISDRRYSPPFAVITNLLEDHLNYYKSIQDYFMDKSVLYRYQKKGDILVLNRDNEVFKLVDKEEGVRQVTFGLQEDFPGRGTCVKDGIVHFRDKRGLIPIVSTGDIRLIGRHNLSNALAAVSATFSMGFQPELIRDAISTFNGLEHRLEFIVERNNVHFYNDSAATTPDAAVNGIISMEGPIILIAGGSDKGLHLGKFIDAINKKVKYLVLLEGSGTRRLLKADIHTRHTLFNRIEDAVHHAYAVADPADRVLLSPGFASFGMFLNEFERGSAFKEAVYSLS